MQEILVKTKGNAPAKDKPRVYFACHPEDFERTFEKVCEDLFEASDCAVYYTADMTEELPVQTREVDLGRMNLFVFPVTFRFLKEPNRAHDFDLAYAKEHNVPILPLMFESGIDAFYAADFDKRQYLSPFSSDLTEVPYSEKLKKYLAGTLLDKGTVKRIRQAFDAYIFLSYRKADRVYANELMRLIHTDVRFRDIAIWFDEFLTPGEAFDEEIGEALSLSRLFALMVTPTLTKRDPGGKPNYVMENEYPMAKKAESDLGRDIPLGILPVLMAELNEEEDGALHREFPDLPSPVDGRDPTELDGALEEGLKGVALSGNDDDPEHLFLIGLAYLDGIDVETDVGRGVEMITRAAEAEYEPAMEILSRMYHGGDRVPLDWWEALKWRERLYSFSLRKRGEEHLSTLTRLSNLASMYGELGDYRRSIELDEKAYALQCKVLGEEHPDALTSLNNLACTYVELGDYRRAQVLNEKVYALRCKIFGEEHPDTLTSLGNLAYTYKNLCDYRRALELNEKAYALRFKILGEEDPYTLTSLNNLATIYVVLGDYQRALELSEKVYKLFCKVFGEEHPHTLTSLSNLAIIYVNLGDYRRAMKLFEIAYALQCKFLGEEHTDTLMSLSNLAVTCSNLGDHQQALEMYEKAYTFRSKVIGVEHPDTLKSLSNLAYTYGKLGDHLRELELGEKAYALKRKVLGDEHPETLTSLNNLTAALNNLGEFGRAVEAGERALPLFRKVYGEKHSATFNLFTHLARAYEGAGEGDKALSLCDFVAQSGVRLRPEAVERIAEIYEAHGMSEKAAALREMMQS